MMQSFPFKPSNNAPFPATKQEARESGMLFYFTGNACPRNHIDVRYVSCGQCRECLRDADKLLQEQRRILRASVPLSLRKQARAAGKTRYFTEIACKNGHIAERLVVNGLCVECTRIKRKAAFNSRRLKDREYAKRHPDRIAAKNARQYRKNRETILIKKRIDARKRRVKQVNAPGTHTSEQLDNMIVAQGWLCANPYCKADLRVVEKQLDHKIPLSRGGSDYPDNLQWLCRRCNGTKHARTMEAFLAECAR